MISITRNIFKVCSRGMVASKLSQALTHPFKFNGTVPSKIGTYKNLNFHSSAKFLEETTTAPKPIFLDEHEVMERVLSVVKNFEKVDPIKVSIEAKFKDDLGLDSLDTVEVVMAIEDEFGIVIPDDEADNMKTIKDAVAFIASHPNSH
mmetsp:Transcript_17543/g.26007  ORF Transcript_17543/g.26007 Transcript_17543/m.26007 type:complete len:148 (-) Transcript_17543:52-495(-)